MASKIAIDPDTGLPVLPEGYYWKVGDGWRSASDTLYVHIVQSGLMFASDRYIADNMVLTDTPDGVRKAAIRLVRWNRAWKKRVKAEAYHKATKHLRGSYPPKRLGD